MNIDDHELLRASGFFDCEFYRTQDSGLFGFGDDECINHYLNLGWRSTLDPSSRFNTFFYLEQNPDVSTAGSNPLVHFLRYGRSEGRLPVPPFKTEGKRRCQAPDNSEWEALISTFRADGDESAVIDVIIPVYKDYAATMRCVYSVLKECQSTPYRLIVIDDKSPDPQLSADLEALGKQGLIEFHRNQENLGFVGTCNYGMALHQDRDIVLLNSDTEVFGDWLDRIVRIVDAHETIGTITPFSNNATICSYPESATDNWYTLELDDRELDKLASTTNIGVQDIPTGVGFCMFIARVCLNKVGLLDVASFGKGYGEENDLCLRIAKAGWRNVLAPNIFVRHYGGSSFGTDKDLFVPQAIDTVEKLHPGYGELVRRFLKEDPIRRFREALDSARIRRWTQNRKTILFVTHNWGGGTEQHVSDMSNLLLTNGIPVLTLRPDSLDAGRAILSPAEPLLLPNLGTHDLTHRLDELCEEAQSLKVSHVHVHHFAGFVDFAPELIVELSKRLQSKYDVTLHDYYMACPRITLIDDTGYYCGEPPLSECETCVSRSGSPFGRPAVWLWRERFDRFLSHARTVFVPNRDVAIRFERFFPTIAFNVRPHPTAFSNAHKSFVKDPLAKRRVALLGAIGEHKGSRILVEIARQALLQDCPLEFIVVGYTDRDEELKALSNVKITGRYLPEDGANILVEIGADIALFASVWPETFSYTLSQACQAGVFPVAFELGAIADRITNIGWGKLLPLSHMFKPSRLIFDLLNLEITPPPSDINLAMETKYNNPMRTYYQYDF